MRSHKNTTRLTVAERATAIARKWGITDIGFTRDIQRAMQAAVRQALARKALRGNRRV